jgi:hypothetical protein
MRNYLGSLVVLMVMMTSCLKEEKPVDKPSVVETVQIPMGADYEDQFYFDLESNETVKRVSRFDWDMAFESTPNGYHVFINGYKYMFAYNTGKTKFDSTYTYNALLRRWDEPNGELNKTAFGEWGTITSPGNVTGNGNVFLVDRGFNVSLDTLGHRKVVVNSLENGNYSLSFGLLSSTLATTVVIPKVDGYNKVFLSFDNGGEIVSIEPLKTSWDINFTRYTHVFYGPVPGFPPTDTLPYQVVGVLSNYQNGVAVAKLDSADFTTFTLADAATLTFSGNQDAIGFDWKNFTLSDENYVVEPQKLYIIKTAEGNYYKMRFVEFYNNAGTKGYPTVEVQLLQ